MKLVPNLMLLVSCFGVLCVSCSTKEGSLQPNEEPSGLSSPLSSSHVSSSHVSSSIPLSSSSVGQALSSVFNTSSAISLSSSEDIPLSSSSLPVVGARNGLMVFTAAHLWADTTETTQAQYEILMGNNPSRMNLHCALCPVENITAFEAMLFANARTKSELNSNDTAYTYSSVTWGTPGSASAATKNTEVKNLVGLTINSNSKGLRLPTESEWLALQAAGNNTSDVYWISNYPNDFSAAATDCILYAWFKDNASGTPQIVAQKLPNGFGLYDMMGNVEEYIAKPSGNGYASLGVNADATKGSLMMMMGVQAQWLTGVRLVRNP